VLSLLFHAITVDFLEEEMNRFEESKTLLLDTTHELMDFLQIKSGNLEIVETPYKLSNVLNEAFGQIAKLFKKNKIK